ncbi:MAG: hypothetical protein JNL12_00510 [Planctomycetes bacterium]|nr:hypothetical protein [Planctomycetota bacterium]
MPTIFFGALVMLFAGQAIAQVNFAQDFNVDSTGWTGDFTRSTVLACSGGSGTPAAMRRNLSFALTGQMISPMTGTALGGNPVTLTYKYKVYDFVGGGPTASPWGSFVVSRSQSASGPWFPVMAPIFDESQSSTCQTKSVTFIPPAGPLFLRWTASHSAGNYWLMFDNVSVVETLPCTTPAPGNTLGPTSACPGSNFTLSLQNASVGPGISYQWWVSTNSSLGPFSPVGANSATHVTSQVVDSWYYCTVTCSVGPVTVPSSVLAVPTATLEIPQDWATGVVDPNCWSVVQIAGTGLPLYSTYGNGSGSVRFDGWNQSFTTENALVSPTLPPTAPGDHVVFDVAGSHNFSWPGSVDEIHIEQSNDNGATWTTIATLDNSTSGALTTNSAGDADFEPTAADWATLGYPLLAGSNRIRFRWDSGFGNNTYLDNVTVGPPPANVPASHSVIGSGCYEYDVTSVAQEFASAAAAKTALDGNSLRFVNTGASYRASFLIGGGTYVAPVAPTVHLLGDEGVATITPAFGATPIPGGSTSSWTIHANGTLTAGPVANPSSFGIGLVSLGTAANLGFYSFHDFDEGGGGQIVSKEVANMLYITWVGVPGYWDGPGPQPDSGTFQFQVDMATGDVEIVWVSMPSVSVRRNIVGATLAGVEPTPTSTSLSTLSQFLLADISAMELSVVGRPVNNGPAPVYTIANIPEFSPGSGFYACGVVFSFAEVPGGYDLGAPPFDVGAPGCTGYLGGLDVLVILGNVGAPSVSFPISWSIPNTPGQLWMQAVGQFLPGSLPNGLNPGGYVTSNALGITITNF